MSFIEVYATAKYMAEWL